MRIGKGGPLQRAAFPTAIIVALAGGLVVAVAASPVGAVVDRDRAIVQAQLPSDPVVLSQVASESEEPESPTDQTGEDTDAGTDGDRANETNEPATPSSEDGAAGEAPGSMTETDAVDPQSSEPESGVSPTQTAEPVSPAADDDASEADSAAIAGGDDTILRDRAVLPDAVRATWQELVSAARSGDIEALRPIIEKQPQPPTFAFAQVDEPIEYLKSLSGDPAGREVLAILLEVLETGFVHVDADTEQEMYLWPYFARYPLSRLTPQETVEMFTILTAGDYQDMLSYGAYIFFRVGIGPDGAWHFFVAGD